MFYKIPFDQIVRQGDIIKGLGSPRIIVYKLLTGKNVFGGDSDPCFSIDMRFNCVVVMTPCCTIQKADYISLCPLYPVSNKFRRNPHLVEDSTRINTIVPPEKCIPPEGWDGLPDEEKQKRIQRGPVFVFQSNFVFKKFENIFEDNMIIDFNDTFSIRRKDLGNNNEGLLLAKILQLTDDTRATLRQKLIKYYDRIPEEEER